MRHDPGSAVCSQLMRADGKPVSVRELVRRLGLDTGERHELKPVLRRMIEDGEVVKIRGARIGLPSRMNLVVGRLTCNPRRLRLRGAGERGRPRRGATSTSPPST